MPGRKRFQKRGGRKYSKSSGRKPGKKGGKSCRLSKCQAKAVKKIVESKLDNFVEDKYQIESTYTALRAGSADDDALNKCYLKEITPGFALGTGPNNRVGNKVRVKFLGMQLRMKPHQKAATVTAGATNTTDPFPSTEKVKFWIIRTPANVQVDPDDLLTKYRRYGLWPQEVVQDVPSQQTKPSVKTLYKFNMSPRYRMLSSQTNTDINSVMTVYSIPQWSLKDIVVPFNKQILLNATTSNPIHHRYFLYIQYQSYFQDDLPGNWQDVEMPLVDIRTRWVYEDA